MRTARLQTGFTLLELLMVVSIMSATAYVALSTLDNDGNNQRYQATVSALENIRRAVVGRHPATVSGQYLQSGYVVDNGVLPSTDVDDLTKKLAPGYELYALQTPVFDSEPDVNGFNNDDPILPENLIEKGQLYKGHRAAYLNLKPGSEGLKDGWGNDWIVAAPTIVQWNIKSYGSNNLADGEELFNEDLPLEILPSSWQVDIENWSVSVSNQTDSDIVIPLGECMRLSLLVFENKDSTDDFHWRRITSTCITGTLAQAHPILDNSESVNFPAISIPQGKHLLVLVHDTTEISLHDGSSEAVDKNNVKKVRFYAGMALPDVTFNIR